MTALVYVIQPDQVCFVMDTLVVAHDDKLPLAFQRKFYVISKNNIVSAGTGLGNLINTWFLALNHLPEEIDIDELGPMIPELMDKLRPFIAGFGLASATLYHFGYSRAQAKYVGLASRSERGWIPEAIPENAIGYKPVVPLPPCDDMRFPDSLVKVIQTQKQADSLLPVAEKVGIGGEIEFVHMQAGEIRVANVHRFDTYADEQAHIAARTVA